MRYIKRIILAIVALLTITAVTAQGEGFNLIVVGDPQPQTEEQITRLENEIAPQIKVIVDEYVAGGYPTAILLTGDVVWDTMEFLPRVKGIFEELGVPVYAVIGNHDHDREVTYNEPLAESHYIATFGSKNYSLKIGNTHFFALDNISFNSYDDYSINVDKEQLKWLKKEIKATPRTSRIAIMMHAPATDFRTGELMRYARRITRLAARRELHFITGHRHRHATADITSSIIEHSVAQVNGNLWFAPICADGTPQGVFCIEERDNEWQWHHRTLQNDTPQTIVAYPIGRVNEYEDSVVIKVIGWDSKWSIKWSENGVTKGDMEQIEIIDPDYIQYVEQEADYNDVIMERLRRSARPANHYFRCRPTSQNSHITITATDRFGRCHTVVVE